MNLGLMSDRMQLSRQWLTPSSSQLIGDLHCKFWVIWGTHALGFLWNTYEILTRFGMFFNLNQGLHQRVAQIIALGVVSTFRDWSGPREFPNWITRCGKVLMFFLDCSGFGF